MLGDLLDKVKNAGGNAADKLAASGVDKVTDLFGFGGTGSGANGQSNVDQRVRLRPRPAAAGYVYGDVSVGSGNNTLDNITNNINNSITEKLTNAGKEIVGADNVQERPSSLLSILRVTNGMVWNFTPTIREVHSVNYNMEQPVHTNAGYNSYKNTANTIISISGDFYANTGNEALYLLACIHFLRSMTLMDYGRIAADATDPNFAVAGAPPPILLLSAYGNYMYNDIPVIIKTVDFQFDPDVDYIRVPINGMFTETDGKSTASRIFFQSLRKYAGISGGVGNNRWSEVFVPQKMQISVQLEQQPLPVYMTKRFNLNAFKRGELLRGGGFI